MTDTFRSISLPRRWAEALRSCNLPGVRQADAVSRWLVISRACVLPMTLISALIGVLLAVRQGPASWWAALLATAGLLAAHASNNMLNDWTDTRRGVDTEEYPRVQYSVHPLFGGLTTASRLLGAALLGLGAGLAVTAALAALRGWPVALFAAAGLALSLSYSGFLKRFALGELASLVVWGPLMIGGTAYVVSGRMESAFFLASLPYGLLVAAVLVGKHIDKREADLAAGVRSLPVLLGERASRVLVKGLFVLFYLAVGALAVLGVTGPGPALSLLALPRLVRAWRELSRPRPAEPPADWSVWPLWYVGWAMYFNRRAGAWLVAGLLVDVVLFRTGLLAA